MRRHLPRLLLTGALLSPVTLYALGLGEIRLNSALNQPFDADIELISASADELAALDVGLASQELFARYGLDRPSFLSGFDFAIRRTPDGRASIKVTSNRSVTEPFVTLLVEASWTRGRLLREYTVLLDPPVFMPSQPETPAPVASAQSGARTEGVIERPAPQPESPQPEPVAEAAPADPLPAPEEPSAPAAAPPPAIGGEYTVERNDTLWRIANRVNSGSPAGVNQTMIALFRANPAAFDGNINRLLAGSVLRIPDIAEIEAVSSGEASAEVARQAAEWSGPAPAQTADESSRLRLVTPAETPAAPTAAAPEATEEGAASPTASGAPETDEKRLEIASPELAAAQRNVDEAPAEPAPEPVDPAAATTAETPPAAAEPVQEQPVRSEPPVQAPARTAPEEAAGPTLAERISQFWWVLVVLGLLVIIGLVVAVVRRRREAESAEASLDSLGSLKFDPPYERAPPAASHTRARAESLFDEPAEPEVEETFDEPAPVTARRETPPPTRPVEQVEPVAAPRAADDTLSSETAVRFDQQDALAEADFHMAYGLYDQAADLVKIAIEREPARRDLKLKLLEIYFVWGNKDLFLDTARDLHATRSEAPAGEWDKVLIMGKQIAAGDAMFQGAASGGMDLVDVNLEGGENRVDVDLFAEPEAGKPAGLDLEFASGERQGPQGESGSDLDFLLDEPARGDDEPTRELDPLARTQETPTIESPLLDDRSADTIRERQPGRTAAFSKNNAEATAELSLDDLGLDVNTLDHSGSLEDTTSLEKDTVETSALAKNLGDDEMTQLAPSLGALDRTIESPRLHHADARKSDTGRFDVESTGTIYIDQVDLSGDTAEQARPDVDATASMKVSGALDVDLDHLSGSQAGHGDTVEQRRPGDADADFSMDVFADRTAESPRIDLDVGEPLSNEDREPTHRQITNEMELSELEPVTMSEVGTKLDLARAYMDMGDPDGARSILEEVLAEGDPGQKQEAQRLLESVR